MVVAISEPIKKPVKIEWKAPNGKLYKDTINMTFEQYKKFVSELLRIKIGSD